MPVAEEAHHEADHVDERDAAGGREDPELEVLGGTDPSGTVRDQQPAERSEREEDRLTGDPRITRLEHHRDSAEGEPLERGIGGRRDGSPRLLEDGGEGDDEATEKAHDHPRRRLRASRTEAPRIRGRGEKDHERYRRLVDDPVHGHDVVAGDRTRHVEGVGPEGGIPGAKREVSVHGVDPSSFSETLPPPVFAAQPRRTRIADAEPVSTEEGGVTVSAPIKAVVSARTRCTAPAGKRRRQAISDPAIELFQRAETGPDSKRRSGRESCWSSNEPRAHVSVKRRTMSFLVNF